MQLVVFVFVGVLVVILGAYYGLVVRREQALIGRLSPRRQKTKVFRDLLKIRDRQSAVEPINNMLERMAPLTLPVRTLLLQSGVSINVSVFVLLSMCLGLATYLGVDRITGMFLAGVLGGVIATSVPWMVISAIRARRMLKFEETLPEAIDLIARALRAGHALQTGIGMVADELPKPMGPEFRTLYDEQNFGLTLPDAMRNFAKRVPVLDARFFVTAVLTQRETGGNLAEVLDNLSSVIRDRFKVRRQVRVISAHGRITGWVLSLLPPCLAVVIFIISPQHLLTLIQDPLGIRMLTIGFFLQVLGTLAIRRIVRIEY